MEGRGFHTDATAQGDGRGPSTRQRISDIARCITGWLATQRCGANGGLRPDAARTVTPVKFASSVASAPGSSSVGQPSSYDKHPDADDSDVEVRVKRHRQSSDPALSGCCSDPPHNAHACKRRDASMSAFRDLR
jgi:hypothetical protein